MDNNFSINASEEDLLLNPDVSIISSSNSRGATPVVLTITVDHFKNSERNGAADKSQTYNVVAEEDIRLVLSLSRWGTSHQHEGCTLRLDANCHKHHIVMVIGPLSSSLACYHAHSLISLIYPDPGSMIILFMANVLYAFGGALISVFFYFQHSKEFC